MKSTCKFINLDVCRIGHEVTSCAPAVVNTCTDYVMMTDSFFHALGPRVREEYPCVSDGIPRRGSVEALTDLAFTCPARRIACAAVMVRAPSVHLYFFEHSYTRSPLTLMRSFHTAELPYVFGSFGAVDYAPTSADRALSRTIQGYWSAFAATGDPNHAGATEWPPFTTETGQALVLGEDVSRRSRSGDEHCDFWDKVSLDE